MLGPVALGNFQKAIVSYSSKQLLMGTDVGVVAVQPGQRAKKFKAHYQRPLVSFPCVEFGARVPGPAVLAVSKGPQSQLRYCGWYRSSHCTNFDMSPSVRCLVLYPYLSWRRLAVPRKIGLIGGQSQVGGWSLRWGCYGWAP